MAKDRLANIWAGFAKTTTLDLSGTNVEGIPRPSQLDRERRAEYNAATPSLDLRGHPSPAESPDPVAAALTAMHSEIEASAKQRPSRRGEPQVAMAAHSEPPTTALEKTLLADISFTRSKTDRSGSDYIAYAAARQDEWQRRKRKKFLGIF